MVNIRAPFRFLACLIFILALSATANAQATRTWVSGVGDDVTAIGVMSNDFGQQ